jgi:hypothetical protein
MDEEGREKQRQKTTRYKRTWRRGPCERRFSIFSIDLEQGHHIATIIGVVVALGTGIFAAYTFAHSSNVQAEDAAYRVLSEHMRLRVEQVKELEEPLLMDQLAESPEYLSNPEIVSEGDYANRSEYLSDLSNPEVIAEEDYAIYLDVAEHGLLTAEHMFRTRGEDEGWRSTAEWLIRFYQAFVRYRGLACETYNPEFIEFISEDL